MVGRVRRPRAGALPKPHQCSPQPAPQARVKGCDDLALVSTWIAHWSDLVDFAVVPVITSEEAFAIHR
jgi:hypothetical protein